MPRPFFQNSSQTDVIAVLMLIGEATVWRAIWSRFRFRRTHWRHWVFALSPGWAPLAANLFTALGSSNGTPNLIYDRPPEGSVDLSLQITNLNSGASHSATNTILQNIWNSWKRGPRQKIPARGRNQVFDKTKEVGLVDLNLDELWVDHDVIFWVQLACLVVQLLSSLIIAAVGGPFETFCAFSVGFLGQTLMLISITPSMAAWTKVVRGQRGSAVMFHRGLDTSEVLFVRQATVNGRPISLEEYAWELHAPKHTSDYMRLYLAATSFILLTLSIAIVGWMTETSRSHYLLLGMLGICSNVLQAAYQPKWSRVFARAFKGMPRCAPPSSSLFSAVGVLLAGEFPSAKESAKLLYPPNRRFKNSLQDLGALFRETVCEECRKAIRTPLPPGQVTQCIRQSQAQHSPAVIQSCGVILQARIQNLSNKQHRDAMATVAKVLLLIGNPGQMSLNTIETSQIAPTDSLHTW